MQLPRNPPTIRYSLSGRSVFFQGPFHEQRNKLKAIAAAAGAMTPAGVPEHSPDLLVTGATGRGMTSYYKAALRCGAMILTERQFLQVVRGTLTLEALRAIGRVQETPNDPRARANGIVALWRGARSPYVCAL